MVGSEQHCCAFLSFDVKRIEEHCHREGRNINAGLRVRF